MKKLITIATVMMAAMFASADTYLYWTVEVGNFTGATAAELWGSTDGSSYTRIQTMYASSSFGFIPADAKLGVNASPYTSYLVRLYEDAIAIAESEESVSSDDQSLVAAIWSGESGAEHSPAANPYSFSGFVIPEPTSAMLILLGLGALALRRGRRS